MNADEMKQVLYLFDMWQDHADSGEFYEEITAVRLAIEQAEKQEPVELNNLRDVHAAQGFDGTWNANQYMYGLFNGLELALSIFENREPVYKELGKLEQTHTDHPMRHWDKTCPACVAEAENQEPQNEHGFC